MFRLILLLLMLAMPVLAQEQAPDPTPDPTPGQEQTARDRDFLTRTLESLLSDSGRNVEIFGFRGALSDRAAFDRLTIADDNGVWLVVEDARLDWNRGALLRGRLEVSNLSAGRIELLRRPVASAPVAFEARALKVPKLPVTVQVDQLAAEIVDIGPEWIGQPASLSVNGNLGIESGAARAGLALTRLDGPAGSFRLDFGYANATGILGIDLALTEAEGGLAADLLGIPESPAIAFALKGEAPIDDFAAELELRTAGAQNLAGRLTIRATQAGHDFDAGLAGDITPLLQPGLRRYVSTDARFDLQGSRAPDGAIRIDRLAAEAGALHLTGDLSLAPDGWPLAFALAGRIDKDNGLGAAIAPGTGARSIGEVFFAGGYDAAQSNEWSFSAVLSDIASGQATIGLASLDGSGTIVHSPGAAGLADAVSGGAAITLSGMRLADPRLAAALGAAADLYATFEWQPGSALDLPEIVIASQDASLSGRARISGGATGPRLTAEGTVVADDLGRFGPLAGTELGGRARIELDGELGLFDRSFALNALLEAKDLRSGLAAPLGSLVRGDATGRAVLARTPSGTRIDALALTLAGAAVEASGQIDSAGGALAYAARIDDAGLLVPGLAGGAQLKGNLVHGEAGWTTDTRIEAPGANTLAVRGTIAEDLRKADLTIRGAVPLGLVNPRLPRGAQAQGSASLDLRLNGAFGIGALGGTITTSGARFVAPGLGIAASNLDLTGRLAGGRVQLDARALATGGGRIAAEGSLALTAGGSTAITIRLDDYSYSSPPTYQTVASGTLRLTASGAARPMLSGNLRLGRTELRLVPANAAGSLPAIRHSGDRPEVRATRRRAGLEQGSGTADPAGTSDIGLDLRIDAPGQIFVRGRGLDAELGGRLVLGGSLAEVAPAGGFTLLRGRLDILGKRLELREGDLSFRGSLVPVIRLVATVQASDIDATVTVEGKATDPAITFTSVPDLPQDEVIARVLIGESIADLSPLQAARLAAALASLAGDGSEGIVGDIRERFGLDDLDLATSEDGNLALRVGKYISRNTYADATVDATGKARINLNIDVNRNVTLRGSLGSDSSTGLGVYFERDY